MKNIKSMRDAVQIATFISLAMLDDYATVIAKLEGIEPALVKERILQKANDLRDQLKDSIENQPEK